jgi:ornithine cyclodeaminase
MPSIYGARQAMGVKVLSVFPGNHGTTFDSHQGAVLLFEARHGQLLAILDASEITAIRTAAVSGVATRVLARTDASRLAILGSGVQARTHLQAMLAVRPIQKVTLCGRNFEKAHNFAERQSAIYGIPIVAVKDSNEASGNAEIICATTSSSTPVVEGKSISAGTHINAVGAFGPNSRELDTHVVARSRFFVDRKESTLNESGDYLIPLKEGAINAEHIQAELGDLLLERAIGRRNRNEITIFKSMGLAIEDLTCADFLYKRARELDRGQLIDLGGERRE